MLLRPKVCKSIPKTKLIAQTSFPTCSLTMDKVVMHQAEHVEGSFIACLLCEPDGNPIKVIPSATAGEFNLVGTPINCYPTTVQYDAWVIGEQILRCRATWFNGAICESKILVTVLP